MKILYIHNKYGKPSGEEHASQELAAILEEAGHKVCWFMRSSEEIQGKPFKLLTSFFSGIYNPFEAARLAKVLDSWRPDAVLVQNLYPFISPAIFKELRKRHIPTVMRCPNYRLFCPYGLAMTRRGEVCERCFHGTDLHCFVHNCASGHIKSLGYALRNSVARHFRWILDGVDVFIVQSEFQRRKFMSMGIPAEKLSIVPGISPNVPEYPEATETLGEGVGFVGRFSSEKGADEFIEAARCLPHINFKVAGSVSNIYQLPPDMPKNILFMGFLKGEEFDRFYLGCRVITVPSKWYEGFPNVILRAFMLNRPVVTTNIGAMDSIVEEGVNGLKVPAGNGRALAEAIKQLYNNPEQCRNMAQRGRKKSMSHYSRSMVQQALLNTINQAQSHH